MPPTPSRAPRIVLPLLLLAGAFLLKWWYRTATVDELAFLLEPVGTIIGALTTEPWTWEAGAGCWFPRPRILVDRSCSGINFMVIAEATFAFLVLKHPNAGCSRPLLALVAAGGAYLLTVFANSGRILLLFQLDRSGIHLGATLHEMLGAFFFLLSLLLASLLLDRLLRKSVHLSAPFDGSPLPTTT